MFHICDAKLTSKYIYISRVDQVLT